MENSPQFTHENIETHKQLRQHNHITHVPFFIYLYKSTSVLRIGILRMFVSGFTIILILEKENTAAIHLSLYKDKFCFCCSKDNVRVLVLCKKK